MIGEHDELYRDFEAVRQIDIVPGMLDVVCRITGMGFAAVARVTQDRWLACKVDDKVSFGLGEGDELKIETTICNEIRDSRKEVVIDHVAEDELYKNHHTPKMYGLQSYISFPIILKNGEFFGTLCAIDSRPMVVSKPEITGTFRLFAQLLAFYLDGIVLINRSQTALKQTERALNYSTAENEVYRQISDHNIKEQVRKLATFSNMLPGMVKADNTKQIEHTAGRINAISNELSSMIDQVAKFTDTQSPDDAFAAINLNEVLKEISLELAADLEEKNITLEISELPVIQGVGAQLKELFLQLLNHAVTFSNENGTASISIYIKESLTSQAPGLLAEPQNLCEIIIEQNGIAASEYNVQDIFGVFLHLNKKQSTFNYGSGLAHCRKIVQNHGGMILAKPILDTGICFSVILPAETQLA